MKTNFHNKNYAASLAFDNEVQRNTEMPYSDVKTIRRVEGLLKGLDYKENFLTPP